MSDASKSTREKAASARAAAEASEKRRERTVRIALIAVVVLIVGGIIGATLLATRKSATPEASPSANPNAALPAGVTGPTYGASVGTVEQPVLDIYEDFQCPACAQFESATGPLLDEMVTASQVKVVYHPMNFLDKNLGNDSSTRAAAAFGCAVDAGATQKYHDVVFANQPAQEGTGYTQEQLKEFGVQAGISGAALDTFNACVDASTYLEWPTLVNQEASARGVSGTPTLYLNGEKIDQTKLTTVDAFKQMILDAGSGSAAASPAPTQ